MGSAAERASITASGTAIPLRVVTLNVLRLAPLAADAQQAIDPVKTPGENSDENCA
jgi:hypothetical protein